jgi:hypothetical protein
MSSYHIMYDDEWQQSFDDRAEALQWARATAEAGRIVGVVRFGLRPKLIAVFPESRTKEGKRLWQAQRAADAQERAERADDLRRQGRVPGSRSAGGGTGFGGGF